MHAVDLFKLNAINAGGLVSSAKKSLIVEDNYFQRIAHLIVKYMRLVFGNSLSFCTMEI